MKDFIYGFITLLLAMFVGFILFGLMINGVPIEKTQNCVNVDTLKPGCSFDPYKIYGADMGDNKFRKDDMIKSEETSDHTVYKIGNPANIKIFVTVKEGKIISIRREN